MKFVLFKTLESIKWYGDIPEDFGEPNTVIEKYIPENLEDSDILVHEFISIADDFIPDNLMDYGDADFFKDDRLDKMIECLNFCLNSNTSFKLKKICTIMLDYCIKAKTLNTGVVIEP